MTLEYLEHVHGLKTQMNKRSKIYCKSLEKIAMTI